MEMAAELRSSVMAVRSHEPDTGRAAPDVGSRACSPVEVDSPYNMPGRVSIRFRPLPGCDSTGAPSQQHVTVRVLAGEMRLRRSMAAVAFSDVTTVPSKWV